MSPEDLGLRRGRTLLEYKYFIREVGEDLGTYLQVDCTCQSLRQFTGRCREAWGRHQGHDGEDSRVTTVRTTGVQYETVAER